MKKVSKWESEKDQLIKLTTIDKKSYEEIGKIYGCSGSNIRKVLDTLNINREPRRKVNPSETFGKGKFTNVCKNCQKPISKSKTYCDAKCENEYKHKIKYQKILDGDSSIMRADYSPHLFKEDILKEQDYKCAICGIPPIWNNKPLTFILDHIDGHASNNKRSNLRCICSNCDSQLDTYKSKNKCGERSYYRYHRSAQKETSEVEES